MNAVDELREKFSTLEIPYADTLTKRLKVVTGKDNSLIIITVSLSQAIPNLKRC